MVRRMDWFERFLQRFTRPAAAPVSARLHKRFLLTYHGAATVRVGHLTYVDTGWEFQYDDEYRNSKTLAPLDGFDDVHRTYRSAALFPFFAVRLPDSRRDDVLDAVQKAGLSEADPLVMVNLFGRRSVASPAFELVPDELPVPVDRPAANWRHASSSGAV